MHRYRQRAAQALRERLLLPLRQLSALEIVVAVAVGVIGGLFPIPLVTSIATLVAGWYVRCNAAELVVGSTVNLFCTPLQFALLPSFARLMGTITREDTASFTAGALKDAMGKGYTAFLTSCGRMVAYATMAWFLVCVPLIVALRAVQRYAVRRELHQGSGRCVPLEEVYVSE